MRRFTLCAIAAAMVFSCSNSLLVNAEDRSPRNLNNSVLNDKYGFHVLALHLNLPDPTTGGSTPFAISGYYEFHGDGTLSGKDTVVNANGITDREYDGTYQVNADGTGTLQLNMSPSFQPVGRFIIVKSGDEIEIIFAVETNLNTFTLKKQHTH